jgi:septum site-determining protein MinC
MDAVILKGRADGFELSLDAAAAFTDVCARLQALLNHLYKDTPSGNVNFVIETGRRLLTAGQRGAIEAIFAEYPRFAIRLLHSDVVDADTVALRVAKARTTFAGGVIRSGQTLSVPGDVVFTGILHKGGAIRAGGSVFVMGSAEGVVHAGFPQNAYAVAAGHLAQLTQVRIADAVEIVADENYGSDSLCYMSDEHLLVHTTIDQLQAVRPQIFERMEES